jgi:hypothetical protein
MKYLNAELFLFCIILFLLWFTNKQHNHIVYLEDTIKIQDQAISQQSFLIECQKIYIDATNKQTPDTFLPFYKKYD